MIMKRICALLLVLLMFTVLPLTARATPAVDLTKEGSITLTLKYKGEAIKGGQFSCVRVGEIIQAEDGNYYFKNILDKTVYKNGLPAASTIVQQVSDNRYFFREEMKLTVANKDGTVKFSGRTPGLYLILQDTDIDGFYKMNPFLVSLPYLKDGKYEYDVDANVKHALGEGPPPTTQPLPEKLPQTGQLNWPVPLLAAAGLALVTLGIFLCKDKKDEYET